MYGYRFYVSPTHCNGAKGKRQGYIFPKKGRANVFLKSANSKSANSWAQSAIANPQILRYANPQITNPQMSWLSQFANCKFANIHHRTEKLPKSLPQVCLAEFYLLKIRIRTFEVYISKKKYKIGNAQITKNIGSANCHICRRSTNITNFESLQICGFMISGTYFADRPPLIFQQLEIL